MQTKIENEKEFASVTDQYGEALASAVEARGYSGKSLGYSGKSLGLGQKSLGYSGKSLGFRGAISISTRAGA